MLSEGSSELSQKSSLKSETLCKADDVPIRMKSVLATFILNELVVNHVCTEAMEDSKRLLNWMRLSLSVGELSKS